MGRWEDRKRHWTDRLVIPESLVYSTRRKARESNRLPPIQNEPPVMWQRLAVLLKELSSLTENTWGDARSIYTKQAHGAKAGGGGGDGGGGKVGQTEQTNRCCCWKKTSKVWTDQNDLTVAEERELEAQSMACFLRPSSVLRQWWDGIQVCACALG